MIILQEYILNAIFKLPFHQRARLPIEEFDRAINAGEPPGLVPHQERRPKGFCIASGRRRSAHWP